MIARDSVLPGSTQRPQKMATRVAQQILTEITEDGLEPGMTLPPEREMVERYGVARGTLREALRLLEMQGVLSMKPGPKGGPVVCRPDGRPLAGAIAAQLQRFGASFRTVLDAREHLEPAITAMAAERRDQRDLSLIGGTLVEMRRNLGDFRAFLEDNHRFHVTIANASQNALCELLVLSLRWINDGIVLDAEYQEYPRERRRRVLASHEVIYDRLAESDASGAAAEMYEHIKGENEFLDRHWARFMHQPLRWDQVSQ
jgi:DNA-binding FadR family transcriptional regulator